MPKFTKMTLLTRFLLKILKKYPFCLLGRIYFTFRVYTRPSRENTPFHAFFFVHAWVPKSNSSSPPPPSPGIWHILSTVNLVANFSHIYVEAISALKSLGCICITVLVTAKSRLYLHYSTRHC